MTFIQFFSIIRARWKLCISILFAVVILTMLISFLMPKKYTAIASVVVDVKPDPLSAVMYSGLANPGFLATQIDIIQSDRVAHKVVRNLRLTENPSIRQQWQEQTDGE